MRGSNKFACDICGNECAADLMREYPTGRRVFRICPECQRCGEKQYDFIVYRPNRLARKSRKEL